MGDIEDTRSPIERFRLGNTLSVSDISSQAWCEMQTAFSLEQPRKRTAAMNAGIKRHEHLELEVHDIRNISIVTESDQWACRFLNMIFGIEELLGTGRTRELCVFGCLDPLRYELTESDEDTTWAIGVIDLIEMRPDPGQPRSTSSSPLPETEPASHCWFNSGANSPVPFIMDNKTRSVPSIPGFAQKRTSRMQLMLYKYLFDGLVNSLSGADWINRFLHARYLDPNTRSFSEQVTTELQRVDLAGRSLGQIAEVAVNRFHILSQSSETLKVIYELQGSGAHLGDDVWSFDYRHLQGDVGYFLEFWSGLRGPNPVLSGESWKCRSCQYRELCINCPDSDTP